MLQTSQLAPPPSRRAMCLAFVKLGLTSFGGGLSGWLMHDFVRVRRWMSEEEFLTGLAMAQALPGGNVVNLATWIGYRMGGTLGALACVLGITGPPMIVVMLLAFGYGFLSRYDATNLVLEGAAAAAIGLNLAMGLRAGRRNIRKLVPAVVMVVVFVAVGLLKLPTLLAVGVMGPISVALAYLETTRNA